MIFAELIFEYSPLFITFCFLAGGAYAYLLYRKSGPWSKQINRLLFLLRFIGVGLITFLILGPLLKQFSNSIEKAAYVIVLDNSLSLTETIDSTGIQQLKSALSTLKLSLESAGYEVDVKGLEGSKSLDSLRFDQKSTNISEILETIQDERTGTNLAGVILASDGIYNRGTSPAFRSYNYPLYTLGLGDTIPKADLNLQNVYYNKIAYQGNQFPVVAEIYNNGFSSGNTRLQIIQRGKVISEKAIKLDNQSLIQVDFTIDASEQGPQHYLINLIEVSGEFTLSNNTKHVYVDVIEGKEKILLVANAPHPDIKALRSVIQENENYELNMYIPGIGDANSSLLNEKYDLVILYQLPSLSDRISLNKLLETQNSLLFILGNRSSIPKFNQVNQVVNIEARLQQKDLVTPVFNETFSKFTFHNELHEIFRSLPPVEAPFGEYTLQAGTEVLLYQRFGSVVTEKPLVAVSNLNDRKIGVILGENFWKWRMQEYLLTENHESFDQLFSKLIQYLSSKEDKRKFKVYPVNREFTDNESVIFDTEVYNDIYEKIYNQKIDLNLQSESGEKYSFSYANSRTNSRFKVNDLTQGTYTYRAKTNLNGTIEESSGSFIISALQVESLNLTADHTLLRTLSQNSGGQFYKSDQVNALSGFLQQEKVPDVIHTTENFLPLLNIQWLLALLIILLSVEWFIRKYQGSY